MAKRSPMSSLQASRTLVKSPPELWAELSDLGSLARHLGEFGDIRITKVDPESRVEWEADRASGTVRLEPSGWGTRVVLTVDTPEPAAIPTPEADGSRKRSRLPSLRRSRWSKRTPCAKRERARSPSRSREPARGRKRGFWARLFGRRKAPPRRARARAGRGASRAEPEPVDEEPEATESQAFGTIEWEVPEPGGRGARAGARARPRRRPRGAQRRARHPRRRAPPALQPLLIPWRPVPSATERSILTAPGPVAQHRRVRDRTSPSSAGCCGSRATSGCSFAERGLRPPRRHRAPGDLDAAPAQGGPRVVHPRRSSRSRTRRPRQSIWMLRQTDKVRESFVREVLEP